MTTMRELIARLEKATGPDRELDCELATVAGHLENANWRHSWRKERIPEAADNWKVPRYTGSIEAAWTLVPEGMSADLHIGPRDVMSEAHVTMPVVSRDEQGRRITNWRTFDARCGRDGTIHRQSAAIALCIAALKARAASEEQEKRT